MTTRKPCGISCGRSTASSAWTNEARCLKRPASISGLKTCEASGKASPVKRAVRRVWIELLERRGEFECRANWSRSPVEKVEQEQRHIVVAMEQPVGMSSMTLRKRDSKLRQLIESISSSRVGLLQRELLAAPKSILIKSGRSQLRKMQQNLWSSCERSKNNTFSKSISSAEHY